MAACETVRAIGPNGPVVINRSDYDKDQAEGGEKIYSLDADESEVSVATDPSVAAVASNRLSMSSGQHAQQQMEASLRQAGEAGDDDGEADTLETVVDSKNVPQSVNLPAALPGTPEAAEAVAAVTGTGSVETATTNKRGRGSKSK